MDLTPALVLSTWTAGLAGAGAVIAWWKVVGRGYTWLTSGVLLLFGGFALASGRGVGAAVGVAAAAAGGLLAGNAAMAAGSFALAALGFTAAAWTDSPLGPVVSGAVFVGGMTSEMLLGHWYLVDPKLPRWALHRLALAGGVGLLVDAAIMAVRVAADGVQTDAIFGWAYVALVVMTGLLTVAVWFSLREPRYSGVMAATGLSYLGVLTALGVLVVGRLIAYG